jgi:hypothetical protein
MHTGKGVRVFNVSDRPVELHHGAKLLLRLGQPALRPKYLSELKPCNPGVEVVGPDAAVDLHQLAEDGLRLAVVLLLEDRSRNVR